MLARRSTRELSWWVKQFQTSLHWDQFLLNIILHHCGGFVVGWLASLRGGLGSIVGGHEC